MANKKPRIAILHYAAPPTIGGVEATIGTHARLFAEHGYPVKVIAGRGEATDPGIGLDIIRDAGSQSPRVLEVNAELDSGVVSDRFHTLVRELTETLSAALSECDSLIAHNVMSLHKNLALTAALREVRTARQLNLIAWCHDFAWIDPQYAKQVHPGLPWDLLKQPWQDVKYVVVSEARRTELRGLWKNAEADVTVVPPGIDAGEFFGISGRTAQWSNDFGLLEAAPLLILPARLTRRKNIEEAIEITAALRDQGEAAKLLVTGPVGAHNPKNAEYLEELRELRRKWRVEEAVIFLQDYAMVDRQTLRDLYLLADALLFPSESEGFGIPILEAGLARLPIFCADLPVFHESARGEAHYFSSEQSAGDVARMIHQVLSADSAYRLKKRIVHEFSWEKIFADRIAPLVERERR